MPGLTNGVFVILNTWMPFVLRPREGVAGTHNLIEEAYVHGLMYSEAFDMMDDSEGGSVFFGMRDWVDGRLIGIKAIYFDVGG